MSNILWKEIRSTYRWLTTFLPVRVNWRARPFARILRRGYRKQMRDNRMWASFFNWLWMSRAARVTDSGGSEPISRLEHLWLTIRLWWRNVA